MHLSHANDERPDKVEAVFRPPEEQERCPIGSEYYLRQGNAHARDETILSVRITDMAARWTRNATTDISLTCPERLPKELIYCNPRKTNGMKSVTNSSLNKTPINQSTSFISVKASPTNNDLCTGYQRSLCHHYQRRRLLWQPLFPLLCVFLVFEPLGILGIWLRIKRYFMAWPFKY